VAEELRDVPERVLAVFAHPDDAEVACGGTLARWASAGSEVEVVVVARGEKGSRLRVDSEALALRRQREMEAADRVLGVARRRLLGVPDGEVQNTVALRARLVGIVREHRPETVVCPDPLASFFGDRYVNHIDHREAGWLALDAVAPAAALPLYFPDQGDPWQVREVLLSGSLEADCFVDIEEALVAKVEAVACHASQLDDEPEIAGPLVRTRAAESGRVVGVRFAETFRRLRLR
jgi:LmbE family N-acetylglucosaminyl deacetylase